MHGLLRAVRLAKNNNPRDSFQFQIFVNVSQDSKLYQHEMIFQSLRKSLYICIYLMILHARHSPRKCTCVQKANSFSPTDKYINLN